MLLDPNLITVWSINLHVLDAELQSLEQLLSSIEKARADRYKFDTHRYRFIVARANLRLILSKYLNLPPQEIKFSYTPKGKPFLADYPHLQFNLSHSQDLAVYALTWNSAVGIDLEYQKDIDGLRSLSERFLSKAESQIIQTSSTPQHTFYKIWTLKEAYLKGTGYGLGKLSEVSTIWGNGEIIGLTINNAPIDWMIYQFYPNSYIGSLVSPIPKAIAFQANLDNINLDNINK